MFMPDHSCLQVSDLDTAIDFYKDALELEVIESKNMNEHIRSAYLGCEHSEYKLQLLCGKDTQDGASSFGHLAVRTENIDETYKKHSAMNCVSSKLYRRADRISYFIRDPDNFETEIVQLL